MAIQNNNISTKSGNRDCNVPSELNECWPGGDWDSVVPDQNYLHECQYLCPDAGLPYYEIPLVIYGHGDVDSTVRPLYDDMINSACTYLDQGSHCTFRLGDLVGDTKLPQHDDNQWYCIDGSDCSEQSDSGICVALGNNPCVQGSSKIVIIVHSASW